jgi:hypothetical protein
MIKVFCLLLVLVTFFSCQKEGDESIIVKYLQTYCLDPWSNGSTDSETLANVRLHLNSRELNYTKVEIKQDATTEVCNACSSTSAVNFFKTS